ncbi:MAG: MBL fold metallo-hydrolase [Opitutae bacterium]|nr:MBL fold metallo-hydrolase [Opitutae bacterium]
MAGPGSAQLSLRAESSMENRKWQPVPGIPDAFVFPRIRRPDVLSSNSYAVEFPDVRLLIDPGALPRQTEELREILSGREGGRVLPLMVCLTHCHLDHSREISAWLGDAFRPAWLAAQEVGAAALADGDGQLTAADLYGLEIPRVPTHMPLLAAEDLLASGIQCLPLAAGVEARLISDARGGRVRQFLSWGGRARIEVVPCAGHSPDSVCFRIGGLLFVGDLLSAGRPLVAGLHGWSAGALKRSLDEIIRLLEEGEVAWCCPGHGDPLPAGQTLDLLRRQRDWAAGAGDVEKMDPGRLLRAVDMALELADEAEEVFSALAGRLLYVADRLEMLEEPGMARRCREAMDMESADARIEQFRGLCRALSAGDLLPVAFAVEATGLVEKLRKSFAPEPLAAFLPTALVNRAQRLLVDFMGVAQGSGNLGEFVPIDIGSLLAEAENAWRASPHLDESIAERADDPDRFAAELARRIGHPPPAQRMPVRFEAVPGGAPALVAAVRFVDTLIQFLDALALAGAESARVAPGTGPAGPFVEIRVAGAMSGDAPRLRAKTRSFARRFALAGFELEAGAEGFRLEHSPPR